MIEKKVQNLVNLDAKERSCSSDLLFKSHPDLERLTQETDVKGTICNTENCPKGLGLQSYLEAHAVGEGKNILVKECVLGKVGMPKRSLMLETLPQVALKVQV